MISIGIDIGGTRIKAIAMNAGGDILCQFNLPTNHSDDSVWKQAVASVVDQFKVKLKTDDVVVGISAPGLPDDRNTCIAHMPGRMQGLEGFKWSEFLECPVFVLNDAVSALVGEAKFGSAKNRKHVVMLTLGTGVGGAILIDGKPYQGAFSKAGHIGHMVIDCFGDKDVTRMPGSIEECIGNYTVAKRSDGRFQSTRELLIAFDDGDEWAKQVWLRSVNHLALAVASVTNIISPELIVIGGGISDANERLFDPLRKMVAGYEWRAGGNGVEIVKAHFGDQAGSIGAAVFTLNRSKEKS